jgi:Dyp-type peroxidase family
MLEDLQANILKGHGRTFAHHIFLQLQAEKIGAAKKWMSDFAARRITSTMRLEQDRQRFKATGADGGAVFTLSISATGYVALGVTPDQFPKEQETPANSIVKDQPAFATGAKGSAVKLGDVEKDEDVQRNWERPFRGNVDALIIVADNRPEKAAELADNIADEVKVFSNVLLNQKGHVLYRKLSNGGYLNIEHFGYADGISHPLYYKDEIDAKASNKSWNDQEPLNLVLVSDPNGRDNNSFGSFLVFRKLEQNVKGFMDAEERAAPIGDSDGVVNKDLPGAMMVGRFRNSNPLVTSGGFTGEVRVGSQITNDFDYSNDAPPAPGPIMYSSKCPFFAHTRITNPRSDITVVPASFVHSVRLTRRSIPYQDVSRFGEGQEDLISPSDEQLNKKRPRRGVGLLFMSYQAHIGKQFEFIQNNWANHGHIAGRNIGQDGVVGQESPVPSGLPFKPPRPDLISRRLPDKWGSPVDPAKTETTFGGFIRNKGGEYFFTPSISFLKQLAGD